jgi:predicted HicB family RNase H-like nuclease
MSTMSLRLPDSLHETAKKLARKDNISLNQLATTLILPLSGGTPENPEYH